MAVNCSVDFEEFCRLGICSVDFEEWPCQARIYLLQIQPFVNLVRFLLLNVTPFIIIFGVILNVVSFSMLSTVILCDSGLSLYLRALAISDNGALFNYAVGIARHYSTSINTLYMNSRFLCGLNSIFMEFFQITSTNLVVSLTWTRVGAIIFPLKSISKNHNRNATVTIVVLTCISFLVSLTKLFSGGYESDSVFEYKTCQKVATPWGSTMYIYIAFSSWLPSVFIFIGNVLLIIHMKKSELIRTQMTCTHRNNTFSSSRTSRTLLAVSIVYLILLLPIGFIETLELYWDVVLTKSPSTNPTENDLYIKWLQEKMLLKWCRGLCFHIYHWNFAINFFLYYLTGKKFRDRVIDIMSITRFRNF
ncbi:hypothetical protein HCN44_008630 [Aphidius gifuensis]|uniref:G-protein coupled receptors family 1 profile domain-containing protein n=1 Tax=Aphidius gifuensis TaxID=684658 RepID=A0A834XSF8_APHGI|nr:uncharacterized protein LOC122856553 [Aphidius gifuensis]KAF7989956.1 hypothetical protein HCN44_008630 [Aphidius gifuensis]